MQSLVFSQDKPAWAYNYFSEFSATRFIENKGQLTDINGHQENEVKFYLTSGNGSVYFKNNSIIFSLSKNKNLDEKQEIENKHYEYIPDIELNTLKLNFVNSNAGTKIEFSDACDDYLNFYYTHCPDGITHVKCYRKATIKNIYNGIDLVLFATGDRFGFKYEFVVRKGGNYKDIKLQYSGADKVQREDNGSVCISTREFQITEKSPYTYQKKSGQKKKLESFLNVTNDIISFEITNFDTKRETVIDPVINWATFYGGSDGDHSAAIALDYQTNVIIAGNTLSKNLPVTDGTTLKGAYDLFVAKFDYTGKRLWATYYGGKLSDYAGGVAVDSAGHIYVAGWTWDRNFPVSANCFQRNFMGGETDGVLLKLLRDGTREWATFVGGSNEEHLYSVATNTNFDIVVAGWSKSLDYPNDSIPISPKNSFDDIVLTSFKNDGTFRWTTFLGGDSADAASGVIYDSFGNIAITGQTHSSNFKLTPDAQQSYYGGDWDAIVAKFTNKGQLYYSSYFGGTRSDIGTALTTDSKSNLYITGYTFSNDMPVTALAFQKTNKGILNSFITKYNSANQLVWSTYLGGKTEDYSFSLAADREDNVMICGQTSSKDFPATKNSYQSTLKGKTDAFAAKFTPDGVKPYWITYYGGDDDDMGNDIAVDYYQNIYVTGDTKSSDFPVTPNAFQKSLSGQWDCFIFKHCATSPYTDIKVNGNTTICDGETIELDAGPGFLFYEWSTGETSQKISARNSGSYTVKVTDTMYCDFTSNPVLIKVLPLPPIKVIGNPKFCEGDSAVLSVPSEYSIWKWSTGHTARTITLFSNQQVILSVTDANGCTGHDTVDVIKSPKPKPLIHGPKVVCAYSTNVGYYVYGVAGHSYQWIINGGIVNSGGDYFNVQIDWKAIGKAMIYIYQTDNTSGCVGVDSMIVKISDHLEPKISTPTGKFIFCKIDTVDLDAGSGYLNYKWNTGETSQIIKITQPGKYWVKVTGEANCLGYDTVDIQIHQAPTPVITGDTSLCINSGTYEYQTPYFADHTYAWDITNGSIVAGASTNKITVAWNSPGVGTLQLLESDTLTLCKTNTPAFMVNIHPLPTAVISPSGKTEFCLGDSVLLTAMTDGKSYLWNTGDTLKTIIARSEGLYSVIVRSDYNCLNSDSILIKVKPLPLKPTITAVDDTLISSDGQIYEWYLDGVLMTGSDGKYIITQKDGQYKVVHRNQFGCSNESDIYNYKYVPKIAYVYMSMPDTIFVRTGEAVQIPVIIDSSRKMPKVGARIYKADVSFDGSVLAVDNSSMQFVKSNNRKTIFIKGEKADTTGLIFNLNFHAALGDSICTNVTIDTILWENANVITHSNNCVVCITNICKEVGTRLYLSKGKLELKQNTPNPVYDETTVEFTTIEKGRHKLQLTDIFGDWKKIIIDEELEPGTRRIVINTEELSSGTYFYILDTPTVRMKGKMQVIK